MLVQTVTQEGVFLLTDKTTWKQRTILWLHSHCVWEKKNIQEKLMPKTRQTFSVLHPIPSANSFEQTSQHRLHKTNCKYNKTTNSKFKTTVFMDRFFHLLNYLFISLSAVHWVEKLRKTKVLNYYYKLFTHICFQQLTELIASLFPHQPVPRSLCARNVWVWPTHTHTHTLSDPHTHPVTHRANRLTVSSSTCPPLSLSTQRLSLTQVLTRVLNWSQTSSKQPPAAAVAMTTASMASSSRPVLCRLWARQLYSFSNEDYKKKIIK
jgi:hypothetical protein